MKLKFIILLWFISLSSCYKIDRPDKPENFIPKDKMVAILVDISLLHSAKSVNKKIIEKNGITPDDYVYKLHGIDSTIFANNNEYYTYQLKDYQDIYLRVKDSLDKLKNKYTAIQKAEKAKKAKEDSIKSSQKKPSKLLDTKKLKNSNKLKSKNNDHEEM